MAAPGKKRYQLTLTEENVNEFNKIAEEMKLPQGTLSLYLDDAVLKINQSIRKFQARGKVSFVDLFSVIGEGLDEIQEEVKKHDAQKTPSGKNPSKAGKVPRR